MNKIKQAKDDIHLALKTVFNFHSERIGAYKVNTVIASMSLLSLLAVGTSVNIFNDSATPLAIKILAASIPAATILSLAIKAREVGKQIRLDKMEPK